MSKTYTVTIDCIDMYDVNIILGKLQPEFDPEYKETDILKCDDCGELDVNYKCIVCGKDLCSACCANDMLEDHCEECKPVEDDGSREREIQQDWR